MSNATQFGKVKVQQAKNHKITNVAIAIGNINSEQSHALQNNLKTLIIRNRDNGRIQYTFVSGESGTKFITIPKFATRELLFLDFASKTLYFQTDKVSTVEIEEFY